MKIKKDKKSLYKFFLEVKQNSNISDKSIAKILNINLGTIKRWNLKKEVPIDYFNDLNKITNYKYDLVLNQKEFYKLNDMFYTSEIEAKRLTNLAFNFIKSNWNIALSKYNFIEPSVGEGAFFNAINFKNKIGIDLNTNKSKFIKMDYFDFIPKTSKNIVIGNPPFGLRGNLALRFINHSAKFANFICFVLPPLFNSNGKGSPMLRVNKDFYLAKEYIIKNKNFFYPNKEKVEVNSIFQIWTNEFSPTVKPISPPKKVSEWIKVFSLSIGDSPSSCRNVKMIGKCDYYLPSTTFKRIKVLNDFDSLPHNRGYGIKILKNKNKIRKIIENINWQSVSFKSTNSANNLRTAIIIEQIERKVI